MGQTLARGVVGEEDPPEMGEETWLLHELIPHDRKEADLGRVLLMEGVSCVTALRGG